MKNLFLSAFLFSGTVLSGFGQNVGINPTGAAPDASAILDVSSPNKGLLIPRIALTGSTDATTITAPATSLLVYNTATVSDVTPGYYYWNGTAWVRLTTGIPSNDWTLLGNSGTVDGTNFIGTIDDVPFNIRVNNEKAGRVASTGTTMLGYQAGNSNTAITSVGIGYRALFSNTISTHNTAIGYQALMNNTGGRNTAVGSLALSTNTSGIFNTALGNEALYLNTTGNDNTAVGMYALRGNISGTRNSAIGKESMLNNTTGGNNISFGYQSLLSNTTGAQNAGLGTSALRTNTTGLHNVGVGYQSLFLNNGDNNVALGNLAGDANTTGSSNTFIGYNADASVATLTNATAIGANTVVSQNNTVILGNNADVGIGTSTPAEKLDVNGNITLSGTIIQNAWTAVAAFEGTWTNYGAGFANASYYVDKEGMVHFKGVVSAGAAGTNIFAIPPAITPAEHRLFTTSFDGGSAVVMILSTGYVYHFSGGTNPVWLSLDGISYRPD